MLRFTLNVVNAKKLDLAFTGLMAQTKDWRKLWPAVINQIVQIETNQFATVGALGEHGEWAALSADYAERKKKEWGEKPILQATERLRSSLVEKTGDTVEELEPLKMRFGTRVPYGIYHQTGTARRARGSAPSGGGGMPARRIFDFTEVDRLVTQKTIQRLALDFSRRLGFAVAPRAGFRDVGAAEARRMGAAALAGGPGAELSANL